MSKRELGTLGGGSAELDGTRPKRRKDGAGAASPPAAQTSISAHAAAPINPALAVELKAKGQTFWQTVRTAVNKEGRVLSDLFVQLPNKREWPDYYKLIAHPISLEIIKDNIDNNKYTTLEAVLADLDLCFNNARKFNEEESPIHKDAKLLQKLVRKEYAKLAGKDEEGSDNEGKKKDKALSFIRHCRIRLQKLVEKTDDSGRLLATMFMELPNRKQWAMYYKTIARPICFDDIFKRLKRKEYPTVADFAKDVEQLFENAFTFNTEGSAVFEDASQLKATFAQLMSDMPEPFKLPEYSGPVKIKLKRPTASGAAQPEAPSAASPSVEPALNPSPPIQLTVTPPVVPTSQPSLPVARVTAASPPPQPRPQLQLQSQPQPQLPPQVAKLIPKPQPVKAPTKTPAKIQPKVQAIASRTPAPIPGLPYMPVNSVQPPSVMHAPTSQFGHYPSAQYQAPGSVPAPFPQTPLPARTASIPPPPVYHQWQQPLHRPSTSASPAPMPIPVPVHLTAHPLESVTIIVNPSNRLVELNHEEGVSRWFVNLGPFETSLKISEIAFLPEEEEDEEQATGVNGVVDDAMDVVVDDEEPSSSPSRGRKKKGKKGGKKEKEKEKEKEKKEEVKVAPKPPSSAVTKKDPPQVLVKLNDVALEATDSTWHAKPVLGTFNVLEIGSHGGVMWKVYVQMAQ